MGRKARKRQGNDSENDDGFSHRNRSSRADVRRESVEIVYGFHSVESLVENSSERIIEVIVGQQRLDQRGKNLISMLENNQVNYRTSDKEEIDEYVGDSVHQGVMALMKPLPQADESDLMLHIDGINRPLLILVLDQIQDPHNLGACIRTADGAGVDAIIVPKNGACPVNQTVRKVAAGAVDRVRAFYVTNLARTLDELREKGVWVTGATDKADKNLYESDLVGNVAIVMGSEGKGLRRLTLEKCDQLASIPMHGSVSSLNVSVATGVFLFEAARQRLST